MSLPASTPALLRKLGMPNGVRFMRHDERADVDRARVERETEMSKAVYEVLLGQYPGHVWEVTCDWRQGGVQIRLGVLMTGSHCYWVRFNDVTGPTELRKRVIEAGGNLLERFRMPRSTFDLSRFLEARPKAVFHKNMRMPE